MSVSLARYCLSHNLAIVVYFVHTGRLNVHRFREEVSRVAKVIFFINLLLYLYFCKYNLINKKNSDTILLCLLGKKFFQKFQLI